MGIEPRPQRWEARVKSNNKGDTRQTPKQLFYDPSLAHKGGSGGKTDWLLRLSPHMLSQYLLIHSEGIKATIKEIQGKTPKQLFYDPSLTHKGGSGDKTDRLFRFSTYAFPIPLNTF